MARSPVFLDTNGWLALLNASDALHSVARTRWHDLGQRQASILTTDLIIAETGNGLARTRARHRFRDAVQLLLSSSSCRVVSASGSLLHQALKLYDARPDQTWGLIDCASFIVMHEQGAAEAFTNDHHFEQAGFSCLLPRL